MMLSFLNYMYFCDIFTDSLNLITSTYRYWYVILTTAIIADSISLQHWL